MVWLGVPPWLRKPSCHWYIIAMIFVQNVAAGWHLLTWSSGGWIIPAAWFLVRHYLWSIYGVNKMVWDSLDFTTGKFLMCHKKPCPLMSVDASPPLVNSENNKFPVVNLCVKSLDLPIGTGAVNIDPRSPNAQFRPYSTLRQSILVSESPCWHHHFCWWSRHFPHLILTASPYLPQEEMQKVAQVLAEESKSEGAATGHFPLVEGSSHSTERYIGQWMINRWS